MASARVDQAQRSEERPALDVVFCGVHAIERDSSALVAINDGKASRFRASVHNDVVMPDRKPDGLKPQIVLVRPEPNDNDLGAAHSLNRLALTAAAAGLRDPG